MIEFFLEEADPWEDTPDPDEDDTPEIPGTAEEELANLQTKAYSPDISYPERLEFLSLLEPHTLQECHRSFVTFYSPQFKDFARLFFEMGPRNLSLEWLTQEAGPINGIDWYKKAHTTLKAKEDEFYRRHFAENRSIVAVKPPVDNRPDSLQTPTPPAPSTSLPRPVAVAKSLLQQCEFCKSPVHQRRLQSHMAERCPKRPAQPPNTTPSGVPRTLSEPPTLPTDPAGNAKTQSRTFSKCLLCGAQVRENRLPVHTEERCPKRPALAPNTKTAATAPPAVIAPEPPVLPSAPTPVDIVTENFPFEVLPPGEWEGNQVISYYRRLAQRTGGLLQGKKIDWHRLEAIETLRPSKRLTGKEGWTGYVVYEFNHSRSVVLECPKEGNATYILTGDWRKMVGHSKQYLRNNHPAYCTRVLHNGDQWLKRVSLALTY